MINIAANLADISTKGNPVEGAILLVIFVLVAGSLGSRSVRSGVRNAARTVKRVGNTEVGRKPKSGIGKRLIGSRKNNSN